MAAVMLADIDAGFVLGAYLGALFRGLYNNRKQVSESGANIADLYWVEALEEQDNFREQVATWE